MTLSRLSPACLRSASGSTPRARNTRGCRRATDKHFQNPGAFTAASRQPVRPNSSRPPVPVLRLEGEVLARNHVDLAHSGGVPAIDILVVLTDQGNQIPFAGAL